MIAHLLTPTCAPPGAGAPRGRRRLRAAVGAACAGLVLAASSAFAQVPAARGLVAASPRAPVAIPTGPLADDAAPIAARAVRPGLAIKQAVRGGPTACQDTAAARRDRKAGITVVTYGASIRYRTLLGRCAS